MNIHFAFKFYNMPNFKIYLSLESIVKDKENIDREDVMYKRYPYLFKELTEEGESFKSLIQDKRLPYVEWEIICNKNDDSIESQHLLYQKSLFILENFGDIPFDVTLKNKVTLLTYKQTDFLPHQTILIDSMDLLQKDWIWLGAHFICHKTFTDTLNEIKSITKQW